MEPRTSLRHPTLGRGSGRKGVCRTVVDLSLPRFRPRRVVRRVDETVSSGTTRQSRHPISPHPHVTIHVPLFGLWRGSRQYRRSSGVHLDRSTPGPFVDCGR